MLVPAAGLCYKFRVHESRRMGEKTMVRRIAGAFVGLVAAFITISLSQLAMALVIKPPTLEMMQDPAAMRVFVQGMPASAYIILAVGYALGSFVGGFVAGKISGGSVPGFLPAMAVGVLLTVMGVINFFGTMPGSPLWAIILCLVTFLPFAALGNKVAGGSPTIEAAI
jgi:hypothetical protein